MNEPTVAELKAEIEALKFRMLMLEAQRVCHHGDWWWQDSVDTGPIRWGEYEVDPYRRSQYEWWLRFAP